jgi:hypothetical protein
MSVLVPAARAVSTTGEVQQADVSNGGVATTTSGRNIDIGEIITGENTGNSIATGDITRPAEHHGGEINYPTEVIVTLIIEPSVATAGGGDGGTASSSDDSYSDDKNDGNTGEDITIINRNDNRSNATIVE